MPNQLKNCDQNSLKCGLFLFLYQNQKMIIFVLFGRNKKKETYRQTCIQTNSSFVKKIYLTRSQAQKWVSEIARKDNI